MSSNHLLFLLLLLPVILAPACKQNSSNNGEPQQDTSVFEAVRVEQTDRVHRAGTPDLLVASQPGAEDFQTFYEMGVKTVINLRRPEETPNLEEERIVSDLGMTYINPGFSSPGALTDNIFDRVRTNLKEAERPILLHCSSANRASAVWLPYRVLDQGVSLEQAMGEAEKLGLRSEKLKEKATRYIHSRQK